MNWFNTIITALGFIIAVYYHEKLWIDISKIFKTIQRSIRPFFDKLEQKLEPHKPTIKLAFSFFGNISYIAFITLGAVQWFCMGLFGTPVWLCLIVFLFHIGAGQYFKYFFKKMSLAF